MVFLLHKSILPCINLYFSHIACQHYGKYIVFLWLIYIANTFLFMKKYTLPVKTLTLVTLAGACMATAQPLTAEAQARQGIIAIRPPKGEAVQLLDARKINDTTVEVKFANDQQFTFDFYGDNIFRLFQDNEGGIVRDPKANPHAEILVKNPRKAVSGLQLHKSNRHYILETSRVRVLIDRKTAFFSIEDKATGKLTVQDAGVSYDRDGAKITLSCANNEYFYGGGVQNGRFSHRGQRIAIVNTNNWVDGGVASPTPFYWSTAGYGMMWHTFKPGHYDFGAQEVGKVTLQHKENYLDVFFMVNEKPVALLNDFYQLTGNPVLLPKFGFYQGHLNAYNRDYWTEATDGKGFMKYEDGKWYNESQKDNGGIRESLNGELNNYQFSARAALDRYLNNDMPLGWFLPNDGYGAGYGQTETLDGNIENLRQFGEYARSRGVEIGLWTQSDLHPKPGIEALLQRDIVKEVRDAGVRVLKTDVAWVGAGYSFGLNGVADVANIMPYYGNNARPFIISLDGWAGTQRYAGIWSGDQTGGEWEYIRFHIPTFIGSGLSGQPNISSDTDGIFGGKNLAVNVREFQWKTFTPMELNMDGWGSNPKYPEVLGGKSVAINRWYLKLKSEIMPYAYTAAREAVDGKPMIRPMFMEEVNDFTLGKSTQYQFMYGDAFLVAPVYQNTAADAEGNDRRDGIYLPKGQWVDYFTGDLYEGGRIINHFDAPLWKLPVLVKADAIIPMTNPHNVPAESRKDYRAYEIYCQTAVATKEYDDDGVSQAYLGGAATETAISAAAKKGTLTVKVDKTTGAFEGFQPNKQTEFRINVTTAPKSLAAKVGGKGVKLRQVQTRAEFDAADNVWFYDARPNLNRWVRSGEESVGEVIKNPQVLVKLAAIDVTKQTAELEVKGYAFAPADRLRQQKGALTAPTFNRETSVVQAYTLTPAWNKVPNADYYEVEFNGMTYSTIRDTQLFFDGLQPDTEYDFRVRAVNADGVSETAAFQLATVRDPLEWAVKGARATTTVANQGGQGTDKLFDHDLKSTWHTAWDNRNAAPFDMIVDLRAVQQLDRIDYVPRQDAGNGTILKGNYSISSDRRNWSAPTEFTWARNGETKTLTLAEGSEARYIKLHVAEGVGGYGSGQQLFVFRRPNTEGWIQGDINRDKRIDDNDLTSYMNYTGLRSVDSDFEYVSIGDINKNGLIDAYDISCVGVELDGGANGSTDAVGGSLVLKPSATTFKAGDIIEVKVSGKDLKDVNALSFALPYNTDELEYVGIDLVGMKEMTNLTYDRLHSNGQKSLYPTFVNLGRRALLDNGTPELFTLKFRAKKAGKFSLRAIDGLLVDRNLGAVNF